MRSSKLYKSINFHLIKLISWHPKRDSNTLYVTFDDGPEEIITEFVLDELKKYNAKATFFCCGNNVNKNPELFQRIINEGHSVANHTYSHIRGLQISSNQYIADIIKAQGFIQSLLFRPPWGGVRFCDFLRLKYIYKFKIVLWDIASGDTRTGISPAKQKKWTTRVKNGDIILFHFCKKHEEQTRVLLPSFLKEMSRKGYVFKSL